MGWGAAFSSAFNAASSAAKSAVQTAVQSVKTAWDYTKQKTGETFEKTAAWGEEKLAQGQQKAQQAKEWTAETYDSSKQSASVQYHKASAAVEKGAKATNAAVKNAFDTIDHTFSTQLAGCAYGNCPANNADPNKPPPPRGSGQSIPPPACLVGPVQVKCGHQSRKFTLVPPGTPTNDSFDQVIQVIHDEHLGEKVTVTFNCGTCPHGNGPDQPRLQLGSESTKATRLFVLEGPKIETSSGWDRFVPFWDFAKHFWGSPGYGDHIPYRGRVICCQAGGNHDFEVQVFPRREFNFLVTAKFEVKDEKNALGLRTGRETHSFKLGGSVEAVYAQKTLSVELPTFEGIKVDIEKLADRLHTMPKGDIFSFNYRLPDIEINGSAKSVEVEGRYNIAWQGEIGVKFEPLVAIEGKIDLIQAILAGYFNVPGWLRKAIKRLREEAEEGFGGDAVGGKAVCKLDFTSSGGIHGEGKWTYNAFSSNSVTGEVSADLDFKVEGEFSGELRFWRVSYAAGVTIKAEVGLAFKLKAVFVGDEPGYDGVIEFKGLIIEGVAYTSVGGSDVGLEDSGKDAINDKKENAGKSGWDGNMRIKDEERLHIVVFEPTTFFEDPSGTPKLVDVCEK
jgi:hypothetical protein